MTSLSQSVERHPLVFSVVALVISVPAFALLCLPSYSGPPMQLGFGWGAVIICTVSLGVSCFALRALIRAERHGCSSTKIALSVMTLFFAFVPGILLALKLIGLYYRSAE